MSFGICPKVHKNKNKTIYQVQPYLLGSTILEKVTLKGGGTFGASYY